MDEWTEEEKIRVRYSGGKEVHVKRGKVWMVDVECGARKDHAERNRVQRAGRS